MNTSEYEIKRWIDKLDSLAIEYEARWGVGILPELVPADLTAKWAKQIEKINMAIKDADVFVMPELFSGTRRGYEALEAAAMAAGHKPHGAPVAWAVAMPCGRELAICATRHDAARLHGNKRENIDIVIWTLEEIANIVSKHLLVNVVDARQKAESEKPAIKPQRFDFEKGEVIIP